MELCCHLKEQGEEDQQEEEEEEVDEAWSENKKNEEDRSINFYITIYFLKYFYLTSSAIRNTIFKGLSNQILTATFCRVYMYFSCFFTEIYIS